MLKPGTQSSAFCLPKPRTIYHEKIFVPSPPGYVGADLSAVVREAGTMAIKRWLATNSGTPSAKSSSSTQLMLTLPDLHASLPSVRPCNALAVCSLFIEMSPIRYTDIGGQACNIQKLREAVEWPLLYPDTFERLGVKPRKGVLLYGPPGCSKTVLARACACESGVNFVAVKGPEVGAHSDECTHCTDPLLTAWKHPWLTALE